jgi:hypothetical protein
MDHAEWMESDIRARRKLGKRYRQRDTELPLNDFQKKVVDIIGMFGGGIYNACIGEKIDWNYGRGIAVIWKRELSTFDFNQLTLLVFLCHEARIRCDISGAGPSMLRLAFWQRTHDGDMAVRHPNLDEAVKQFREYLPVDHRILYKEKP